MNNEDQTEVIDPDVDVHSPAHRRELLRHPFDTLGVIAAGGAIGALARYGLSHALPTSPGGFPWATLWTNIFGCALIGVLIILITQVWVAHRLIRPFLGVGILGGFTTFSTYAVEARDLLDGPNPALGLIYLAVTVLAALLAVELGIESTRWVTRAAGRKGQR